MPAAIQFRKALSDMTYVASSTSTAAFSRGPALRELQLRLSGQLTCTSANNTAANTQPGDIWGLIRRVRLVANNSKTVFSMTGEELAYYNFHAYGGAGFEPITGLADGTTTNPSFDTTLILPLWAVRSAKPIDTILPTRFMQNLHLEIDWGTHLNINSSASGFTVVPTLNVNLIESAGENLLISERTVVSHSIVATAVQSDFTFSANTGFVYPSLLINTKNGSGVDVVGAINNIKIMSGGHAYLDSNFNLARQANNIRSAISIADFPFKSSSNNYKSWAFINLLPDGRRSEGIDTLGLSEFKVVFDVATANTTINLIVTQDVIPRGKAAPVQIS